MPGGDFAVLLRRSNRTIEAAAWEQARRALLIGALATLLASVAGGALLYAFDARQRRARETALLGERLRLATDAAAIGVWDYDIVADVNVWDETMHRLYGVRPGAFEGDFQGWRRRVHPEDVGPTEEACNAAIAADDAFDRQFRIVTDAGELRHIKARARVLRDDEGRPARLIGVSYDVTDRVRREQEMRAARDEASAARAAAEAANAKVEHEALHDPLTELPNRRGLARELDAIAAEGDAGPGRLIVSLDLDRFKPINDTFGHAAGDALLQHVARRLRAAVDPTDFVARIGGDEFVVVTAARRSEAAAAAYCSRLIRAATAPIKWDGALLEVGASAGYAPPAAGKPPEKQLADADLALYKAKSDGRNHAAPFTQRLADEARERMALSDDLKEAVFAGEIEPFFQPQIHAASGRVFGVEALARWRHPTRGLVPPSVFLPLADELKLAGELDSLILARVLRAMGDDGPLGRKAPRFSVNVSARRLRSSSLLDELQEIPRELRARLGFEILETIYVDRDDAELMSTIDRIRDLGVAIELDDFGSGHASIAGILALKPDYLKLDRIFAREIDADATRLGVLRSLLGVARSVNVPVIAEGVETAAQARILREEGCLALQGFWLGAPMPQAEAEAWLTRAEPMQKTA